MGWSEDKGLGRNEDGRKEHVKVKKRENGEGLGVEDDKTGGQAWSSSMVAFNAVLDVLKKSNIAPVKTDHDESDQEEVTQDRAKSKKSSKDKERRKNKKSRSKSKAIKSSKKVSKKSSIDRPIISVGIK